MIQTRTQHFMLASGMLYSIVQVGILIFAGVYLLPLLGPPGGTHEQRYEGYANYPYLFKVGNYLMGLPALFFFLFLGGVYSHFSRIDISVRGILLTALLSGAFDSVVPCVGILRQP